MTLRATHGSGPLLLILVPVLLFGACRSGAADAPRGAGPDPAAATTSVPPEPPPALPLATDAGAAEKGTPESLDSAVRAARRTLLPDFGAPGWTRVASHSGAHLVCWRALGDEGIPRNRAFTLEAWVFEDGAALPGIDLTVTASMPEHGHGMLHAPRTQDRGDGSYLVEGMLFHMRGHWELQFNLLQGADSDQAQCAVELK